MRPRHTIPPRALFLALTISLTMWAIAAYAAWEAIRWVR